MFTATGLVSNRSFNDDAIGVTRPLLVPEGVEDAPH